MKRKLYEQYIHESTILVSLGYSVLISTMLALFSIYLNIVIPRRYIMQHGSKRVDEKMTNAIRKIVGDDTVVVYEILNLDIVNAYNCGKSELFYFSGLVDKLKLSDRELMAILLHEYGHYVNRDMNRRITKYVVSQFSLNVIFIFIGLYFPMSFLKFFIILMSRVIGEDISHKIISRSERKSELLADSTAKKYGYGNDLISSFEKLLDYSMKKFCSSSMSTAQCLKKLESSNMWDEHPPTTERIEKLKDKIASICKYFISSAENAKKYLAFSKLRRIIFSM
jgi:Zn-dependent protease with chaperone function